MFVDEMSNPFVNENAPVKSTKLKSKVPLPHSLPIGLPACLPSLPPPRTVSMGKLFVAYS